MLSVDDIMQEDNAKRMKDPQCCYEDNDMQEDNAKRMKDPLYLDAEFEYDQGRPDKEPGIRTLADRRTNQPTKQ